MASIKRILGRSSVLFLGSVLQLVPSFAATPQPKVGDCLNYQPEEIFLASPKGTQVKCSQAHNSEIYRIGKFKSGSSIPNMNALDLAQAAQSACMPWSGTSKFLNQWTFRVPTNAQWKTGARWIRCEALKIGETPDENGQLPVISYRGKKLDFK